MLMSKSKKVKTTPSSKSAFTSSHITDDDDDFQNPTQSLPLTQRKPSSSQLVKPSNAAINRQPKKPKKSHANPGKENLELPPDLGLDSVLSLESMESTVFCSNKSDKSVSFTHDENETKSKDGSRYLSNSIESRLLSRSGGDCGLSVYENTSEKVDTHPEERVEDYQEAGTTQLDLLLDLCCSSEDEEINRDDNMDVVDVISCPLCGIDISDMTEELRHVHTNECLDKPQVHNHVDASNGDHLTESPGQVLDDSPSRSHGQNRQISPVLEWLRNLDLSRYEEVFIREEIDWDSLRWLTDEDLYNIGITALGPRKKIVHALNELRTVGSEAVTTPQKVTHIDYSNTKIITNKKITDFFPGFTPKVKITGAQVAKPNSNDGNKRNIVKKNVLNRKMRDIPSWCSIEGTPTPFRVDAFKYLRRDCFHWFLTHFHADHYGGLTKSFCHGKIYCSLITAKLVNLKLGIPWENIEVLPLNQKIDINGVDVTCFDANHCPGSLIILFQLPNGKAILHTGDFRFCEDMTKIVSLQTRVHTLILDTTYCDPQYDFPKQDAVIQYVLEAIQAEAFNPKTLFLIGSYTIGKERVFMEVARVLRKKIYITAAKMRILECLGMTKEDMQWLTLNESESHIHVVPMWTLASFKRLKHVSNMYKGRYSLIVAFSPTGWSFTKGKKSTPGKRSQQGTIIRYEVPYSEHSSFTELKEFVKFISPENIIPSVNNHGQEFGVEEHWGNIKNIILVYDGDAFAMFLLIAIV
ncbi:hypothetical protein LXL04_003086 [Taraxacum kok-saghyz]